MKRLSKAFVRKLTKQYKLKKPAPKQRFRDLMEKKAKEDSDVKPNYHRVWSIA